MANLEEFNFLHQTAESHHPIASTLTPALRASELASSQKEEEEDIICGVLGARGNGRLKTSKQNSLSTRRVTLVRLRPRGESMASK